MVHTKLDLSPNVCLSLIQENLDTSIRIIEIHTDAMSNNSPLMQKVSNRCIKDELQQLKNRFQQIQTIINDLQDEY